MTKQALFDVLIVLVGPVLLVLGYLYVGTEQITALLTFSSIGVESLPGSNGEELGTKTKAALNELSSIRLDRANSIFTDPAFNSLVDFTGTISTTSIGREYPFSTPEEIRALFDKSRGGSNVVATSSTKKTDVTKKPVK